MLIDLHSIQASTSSSLFAEMHTELCRHPLDLFDLEFWTPRRRTTRQVAGIAHADRVAGRRKLRRRRKCSQALLNPLSIWSTYESENVVKRGKIRGKIRPNKTIFSS